MPAEKTSKFLNCRDWRSFLAAAQSAVAYPSVAVKASHAWLSGRAANTYRWLLVNGDLVARKTLGI
jgi:hypothetical protein